MTVLYFITHPNVVISREVPVPRWPLSELGRQRMRAGLVQRWIRGVTSVYCSTEQKAIDGAEILAQHLSLGPPNGGGNYYSFTMSPRQAFSWWRAFDTT